MAPIKFEEHIKEKLESRRINPSPAAWERVAAQMHEDGKNKQRKWWSKMAVAAGFIGILILGSLFFFDIKPIKDAPFVNVPKSTDSNTRSTSVAADDAIKTEEKDQREHCQFTPPEVATEKPNRHSQYTSTATTETTVILEEKQLDKPKEKRVEKHQKPHQNLIPAVKRSVDEEVDRLLATVSAAEQEGVNVSDSTIDSLLAQAQENIIKNRIYDKQTQRLSATALLQSVEDELDQSFRDRIFDALKDGYNRAREALVSRND